MIPIITPWLKAFFRKRTRADVRFEVMRLKARRKTGRKTIVPPFPKLHVGCGRRHVPGWFNIDVYGTDFNVDLASGHLPIASNTIDAVVSQQVIEHLDLEAELMTLMQELRRVMRVGGEIYLSTPDMEKICRAYLEGRSAELIADRKSRDATWDLGDYPDQHIVNDNFHQSGEHQNLFDFGLLEWLLKKTGFAQIEKIEEKDLLARFPEFPPRRDDFCTLYVRARAV